MAACRRVVIGGKNTAVNYIQRWGERKEFEFGLFFVENL